MTDERTTGELADALDHEVRMRRSAPESYDEGLTDLYDAAAQILRNLDGERIAGWVPPDITKNLGDSIFRKWADVELIEKGLLAPATLILTSQEQSDE